MLTNSSSPDLVNKVRAQFLIIFQYLIYNHLTHMFRVKTNNERVKILIYIF